MDNRPETMRWPWPRQTFPDRGKAGGHENGPVFFKAPPQHSAKIHPRQVTPIVAKPACPLVQRRAPGLPPVRPWSGSTPRPPRCQTDRLRNDSTSRVKPCGLTATFFVPVALCSGDAAANLPESERTAPGGRLEVRSPPHGAARRTETRSLHIKPSARKRSHPPLTAPRNNDWRPNRGRLTNGKRQAGHEGKNSNQAHFRST